MQVIHIVAVGLNGENNEYKRKWRKQLKIVILDGQRVAGILAGHPRPEQVILNHLSLVVFAVFACICCFRQIGLPHFREEKERKLFNLLLCAIVRDYYGPDMIYLRNRARDLGPGWFESRVQGQGILDPRAGLELMATLSLSQCSTCQLPMVAGHCQWGGVAD